ncbi:kinase-like protein [Colletotrichum sp. SAR 10_70]|nr:kinase-like protein [Colletotrichum sp. SAR 10_71]KAI8194155.1 kinase-like protein [Colletotrichum sp. SAR 10_70]KAI8228746.1 kinase-like protein [Colletotrichum sp. SAR 10_86]
MRGNNINTPKHEDDVSAERIPGLVVTTPDDINQEADSDIIRKKVPGLDTEESSTVNDYGWSEKLKHDPVEELARETQDHLVDQTGQAFPADEDSQPITLPELETGDLGTRLRAQAIVHPHEEMGSFVPIEALKSLITQEAVVEELKRATGDETINDASLENIAEYVCRKHRLEGSEEKYTTGLKLFAILLLIEKPETITNFIAEGLRDKDLPFKLERKGGGFQLLRKSAPFDKIKAFNGWKHIEIETFERNQWSLLSPIFTKADKANKVLNYPLEPKILLPFVESEERSLSNPQLGGYGTVFKVRIHPSHHSFDTPEFRFKESRCGFDIFIYEAPLRKT